MLNLCLCWVINIQLQALGSWPLSSLFELFDHQTLTVLEIVFRRFGCFLSMPTRLALISHRKPAKTKQQGAKLLAEGTATPHEKEDIPTNTEKHTT